LARTEIITKKHLAILSAIAVFMMSHSLALAIWCV